MTPPKKRDYPKLMRVPRVEGDAWLSQPEAARQLGIALMRTGALIACGHLAPAENHAGRASATITNVQAEQAWRENATFRVKITRLLKGAIGLFWPTIHKS